MAKWIGAAEDIFMVGRWISVVVGVIGGGVFGGLFLTHSGPFTSGAPVTPTPIDAGPVLARSSLAMRQLQSMAVSLDGTLVSGGDSVQITGTGTLTYPHEENLALELRIPTKVAGDPDTIVAVNERIEKGRILMQIPSLSSAFRDVTNDQKSQLVPGLDPVANLGFADAFRSADDQGDVMMDGVEVHHFSLAVSPNKYLEQLRADPENTVSTQVQASLTNAGILVDVWIGAQDNYVHQMKIAMTTSDLRWDVTYSYSNFVKRSTNGSV